jgi:hypothetical protein
MDARRAELINALKIVDRGWSWVLMSAGKT